MSSTEANQLKEDINAAFEKVFGIEHGIQPSLSNKVASKLYEIKILGHLLQAMATYYKFEIVNQSAGFKAAPSAVNNSYTYIRVKDKGSGKYLADIRTDTEFVGLSSYQLAQHPNPKNSGEYHELDIMVCEPELVDGAKPTSDQVYIAVECKHWAKIPKRHLREMLGVRRELSFLNNPAIPHMPVYLDSKRPNWSPPSELIFAVSNDGFKLQSEWKVPSDQFGIEIWDKPV